MLGGFAVGLAYRALLDEPDQATLANYARSGLHGAGVGLTVWLVQTGFVSAARSALGAAMRRMPLVAEVLLKSLAMTAALVAVGLALQAALYAEPYQLHWLTRHWLTTELPRIVVIGFGLSVIVGALAETRRLIGGAMLASVLLGTYQRPVRQQRIVMFLDLANSTRLAERMGELRVHDLITQFFFDIDEPIGYLGRRSARLCRRRGHRHLAPDRGPPLNGRCVACFFAIGDAIAGHATAYEKAFGLVPEFRAGLHAGPLIVSACGDEKRQLAFFGDTMNVGARLCDYCKSIDAGLVASGDLMRRAAVPDGVTVAEPICVAVRGREAPVEAHVVARRLRAASPRR